MQSKYLNLLEKIISISSISNDEMNVSDYIFSYLSLNFVYDHLEKQYVSETRYNIILTRGKPKFFFTTHLDTVPPYIPYSFKNGKIYGRGACDAKGQIITQLWALEELILAGIKDYGLLFVIGEEVDSIGARTALKSELITGNLLLNGEPTDGYFASSSRGVIEIMIEAHGEARHSSITEANSAVNLLVNDIFALLRIQDNTVSINVGKINGGIASNIVASNAKASLCIRFAGNEAYVLDLIKNNISHSFIYVNDVIPEFKFYVPNFEKAKTKEVFFCSDASLFSKNFDKVMLFGPGSIKYAHSDDEHIVIDEIIDATVSIQHAILNTFK